MARVNVGEVGKSGLLRYAGQVQEAYTAKLHWPGAYAIYDEMRRRDPTVRTIWNALVLLARTTKWYAEPGGESKGDGEAATFLESCIEDMSHTIQDAIEDALSCVLFGWSWMETVYKRREDGGIGWRKWAMRRQSSFYRWEFDAAGGVQGMVQRPGPDYEEITIPVKKSLHFTSQRDGGNPEGFALLESLYEVWYYLKNYQILQGIGWQRSFVGLPVFEFEEKPGEGDESAVKTVGEALTVDEKQYVSVPSGVKFRLESAQNSGAEALLNTIKYYRLLMLQTLLADFIDLGTGQTGSWALGSDKSQLFLMAVDGFLDRIGSVVNRFGVARLMAFNVFTGMTGLPRLVHTKVEKPALSQLGSWLQQVTGLLNWTQEDEDWLRRRAGMPTIGTGGEGRGAGDEGEEEGDEGRGAGDEGEDGEELAELAEGRGKERAGIEESLRKRLERLLREQQGRVMVQVGAGRNPGEDEGFWEQEEETLRRGVMGEVLGSAQTLVGLAMEDAAKQFGGGVDWALVNADAARWARESVGKLVSGVTESTKEAVREAVATWIETGAPLGDLARALTPTFGPIRAEMIAATEVTRAYAEANGMVWRRLGEQGIIFKREWRTARDERVCPVCGPLDGVIVGLEEKFPGGLAGPPAHPRCRCWVVPKVER